MKIQDKFLSMDLDQTSKFLQKTIGVSFKKKGLQCPKVTWIKYGYQGEMSIQELAKEIWKIYERDRKQLPGKQFPPSQERAIRYYQIEKGRDLIKTIQLIQATIQEMWWSHSYVSPIGFGINKLWQKRGAGQTLEEIVSAFIHSLNAEKRKLDQDAAKFNARHAFNQYASLFHDFFRSFTFSFDPQDFLPRQPAQQLSFNPYKVLGLPTTATASEIKKKYHQLALQIHPDKNPNDPKAAAKFQELQKAYEALSNKA
jgi:hypothetical protein